MTVTVDQIIYFFGGDDRGAIAETARRLGCTPQFISIWRRRGYVSGPMADVIEHKSEGAFKAIDLREQARVSKGKRVH